MATAFFAYKKMRSEQEISVGACGAKVLTRLIPAGIVLISLLLAAVNPHKVPESVKTIVT
jgi:hypothetical protein